MKSLEDYGKSDIGIFRRTDLKLRCHYYGLQTRLYQVGFRKWVIQLLNYKEQYKQIRDYFGEYIVPVTLWADLVTEPPKTFLSVVSQMDNIADSVEGISMNHVMMNAYIKERYLRLP